jgi:hypothetical protein
MATQAKNVEAEPDLRAKPSSAEAYALI